MKISLKTKKKEKTTKKGLIITLTIFFAVCVGLIFLAAPIVAYELLYQNKIYAGVYVDDTNVGGLTPLEAINKLNQYIDNLKAKGLDFYFNGEKLNVGITTISPSDPDLAYQILNFDVSQMVNSAYWYGRNKNFLSNFKDQISAVLSQQKFALTYTINEEELKNSLKGKFGVFEKPAQDAKIVFSDKGVEIQPETSGFLIDYDQAISDFKNNINLISLKTIQLKTKSVFPTISKSEAEKALPLVEESLKQEQIILKYKDKSWQIGIDEFKNWLGFKKENEQVGFAFQKEPLDQKLAEIAKEINIEPQDAKFVMIEGMVTEFQPSLPGLVLDIENSAAKINQEFFINKKNEIDLAFKTAEPALKTEDVNTYGIKELIGSGVSDFSGSHVNRIKNIKNAVQHLNGLIIPPGEFSIVQAIGEVNAATGYLPEFVIKGDRTISEYGGGLCQIGTTVFRAALYSGLPILERQPHSYIVSYYKPIGMDATIYGPHPDLRFNNDTGNYILLQIKIEGTQLTFEFWGTSDGRKIEITDPQLYNWTAIPPDKLIENSALKPGVKNQLEKGRRGADATFYRYITKPDGTKTEETFRSHYVPWPNIYEVGVQPKAEVTTSPDSTEPVSSSDSSSAGQSGSPINQNANQNINSTP